VIVAFEEPITRVHDEPGVEPYALHEWPDRLVMIEKYESEQARSQHLKGAALADLRGRLGRQAQQQPRRAGPYTPPGRKRAERRAVTVRRSDANGNQHQEQKRRGALPRTPALPRRWGMGTGHLLARAGKALPRNPRGWQGLTSVDPLGRPLPPPANPE